MPGFDGTGPRGPGRGGRRMGSGGNANRHRHGQNQEGEIITPGLGPDYVYEYTLEELKERKQALEKEIQWLEERIREFEENASVPVPK